MGSDINSVLKRSNASYQRQKAAKAARVEKKKHPRKAKNRITFPAHPKKKAGNKR